MISRGLMSSDKQDWETPMEFVHLVEDYLFDGKPFILDCCCYPETAKAPVFYTEADDALTRQWNYSRVWMNPPYGRAIPEWLAYAHKQSEKYGITVVCLVPARPDTKWFHEIACLGKIIFLKRRIRFLQQGKDVGSPAFPSMLVVFDGTTGFDTWDWQKE